MSLLINESYANPTTPLWASSGGGGGGGTIIASEFQTTSGGDVVVKDVSGNTALRLATGSSGPSPAYIQTDNSLYFGQVGQGSVATTFTPSVASSNADVFSIGGQIGIKDASGNTCGKLLATSLNNLTIQTGDNILFQKVGATTGNTSLKVNPAGGFDELNIGIINANNLNLNKLGSNASCGAGTLTNGQETITVNLSDITASIFLQRTAIYASTALGELRVSSQNASNFTVTSSQPANPTAIETGDQSGYTWMIINGI